MSGIASKLKQHKLHTWDIFFNVGRNGQKVAVRQLTELTPIAAAASTSTTIRIPANALVFAVSTRVVTPLPGTTSYSVGVSGAATRYGSGISSTSGTTYPGTNDGLRYYASDTAVVITPNNTPSDGTGQIRVTIHFLEVTPPKS
jgi:hypothetical protein